MGWSSKYKPSFATGILGGGWYIDPRYDHDCWNCWKKCMIDCLMCLFVSILPPTKKSLTCWIFVEQFCLNIMNIKPISFSWRVRFCCKKLGGSRSADPKSKQKAPTLRISNWTLQLLYGKGVVLSSKQPGYGGVFGYLGPQPSPTWLTGGK